LAGLLDNVSGYHANVSLDRMKPLYVRDAGAIEI
jgi:hypothetical protein